MIKEQSLGSLERSTEVNLTQTARQAADNKDWELAIYKHSPALAALEGMPFSEHEFLLSPA